MLVSFNCSGARHNIFLNVALPNQFKHHISHGIVATSTYTRISIKIRLELFTVIKYKLAIDMLLT